MGSPLQKHVFIIQDDQGKREFILDAPMYTIGRDPKCDIRLFSQFVSRRHATLVQLIDDHDTFYYRIVDGNLKAKLSANGLLINGRKLPAHDLQNEDEIIFAAQVKATYLLVSKETLNGTGNLLDATVTLPRSEMTEDELV